MDASIQDIIGYLQDQYGGAPIFVSPYEYRVDFPAIAAGGTATKQLQINSNSDFIITRIGFEYDEVVADASVLIIDSATGQPFSYGPTPVLALCDYSLAAGLYGGLSFPRWFAGRSSLSVQLTAGIEITGEPSIVFSGFNVRGA